MKGVIIFSLVLMVFLSSCSQSMDEKINETNIQENIQNTVGENENQDNKILSNSWAMIQSIEYDTRTQYSFMIDSGREILVTPIDHATLALTHSGRIILIDPVGEISMYESFQNPDAIFITHEHGDHFNPEILSELVEENTQLYVNPAVYEKLSENLKAKSTTLANGDMTQWQDIQIETIPAYNIREEALNYHPQGRDNGYILTLDGIKIYISGDTENTPEMKALQDIDIAFVSMNLPYTMGIDGAIDGVLAFAPKIIFPYHYRGSDGISDIMKFKNEIQSTNENIEVILHDWYSETKE